ncbi:hypothetical protein LHFGNBLO_002002 [Mesorhizobium sp. AR10]|uniref:hypothetical protein n=1 Tax=Mesorhizobium sp. AR10 TaxID=2865839 RepID=UPI00215E98D6|nr:hypothetical protein [Mesorhizobium sp. AR10]UVK40530.1 hypothetical protein LHFGNBLO_002002 [Mesorhizobium sp. AR10]
MSPLRLSTVFVFALLASATMPGATAPASAQVANPSNSKALLPRNELRALQNKLQRQQFQQQQQQFRAQDREIVTPQPLVVPRMRSCQLQPSGNGFVTVCR